MLGQVKEPSKKADEKKKGEGQQRKKKHATEPRADNKKNCYALTRSEQQR